MADAAANIDESLYKHWSDEFHPVTSWTGL